MVSSSTRVSGETSEVRPAARSSAVGPSISDRSAAKATASVSGTDRRDGSDLPVPQQVGLERELVDGLGLGRGPGARRRRVGAGRGGRRGLVVVRAAPGDEDEHDGEDEKSAHVSSVLRSSLVSVKVSAVLLAACVLLAAGSGAAATRPSEATLLAAGDIASCSSSGDEATARLLGRLRGTIAALGDTVYERGTDAEFARCYAPSWGRYRSRTRPAVGNHEYGTAGAAGYFRYFGAAAPTRRAATTATTSAPGTSSS